MKKFAITFCVFCLLYACKSEDKIFSDRAIHILTNAGEPYLQSSYISSPLIHGAMINMQGDSLDVMVISRLCLNSRMEIKPFATFEIVDGPISKNIILALPVDKSLEVIDSMSYIDFVIKRNEIKVLIDQYFSNYRGQGQTRVVNWGDTDNAIETVESFMNKELKQ